jgi:ethanolaminephosphotransferase
MVLFSTESVRLDESNKKALDIYKYQGGDNGISYIHFHSPLASWLVTFLPMTVAPNTITLLGALCLVVPHIA